MPGTAATNGYAAVCRPGARASGRDGSCDRRNHCSTSRRCQPTARPRNLLFRGNRPMAASAASIHRCRRVRRATSWAVRISPQGGYGSFTHFERRMDSEDDKFPGVTARPASTLFMVSLTHDVWFRWFKGKLSRMGYRTRFATNCSPEFRSNLSDTHSWQEGDFGVCGARSGDQRSSSRISWRKRSAGSVSSASAIARNSGTLTWR